MDRDTDIGGPGGRFPETRRSVVLDVASPDAETRRDAFGMLVGLYWKPVYKYLRLKWRLDNEDAKDLTQSFFGRALEKEFFAGYDPARARFRTFLRTCLDGFTANQRQAARRIKRGGGSPVLSLDFEAAEGELKGREPGPGRGGSSGAWPSTACARPPPVSPSSAPRPGTCSAGWIREAAVRRRCRAPAPGRGPAGPGRHKVPAAGAGGARRNGDGVPSRGCGPGSGSSAQGARRPRGRARCRRTHGP